jgi:hypothetical protein
MSSLLSVSTCTSTPSSHLLTAVEAARPVDGAVATTKSTADARAVAPNHLRKVAPSCIEMRVVVGVLGLLLVPAVRSSTRKLYPSLVVIGRSIHRGEVAARAFLILSAITVFPHI